MGSNAPAEHEVDPDLDKHTIIAHESSTEEEDGPIFKEEYEAEPDTSTLGMHVLGLTRSYVPRWKSRDAFREFYQNWYAKAAPCSCQRGNS
jgi:hypothetical protein